MRGLGVASLGISVWFCNLAFSQANFSAATEAVTDSNAVGAALNSVEASTKKHFTIAAGYVYCRLSPQEAANLESYLREGDREVIEKFALEKFRVEGVFLILPLAPNAHYAPKGQVTRQDIQNLQNGASVIRAILDDRGPQAAKRDDDVVPVIPIIAQSLGPRPAAELRDPLTVAAALNEVENVTRKHFKIGDGYVYCDLTPAEDENVENYLHWGDPDVIQKLALSKFQLFQKKFLILALAPNSNYKPKAPVTAQDVQNLREGANGLRAIFQGSGYLRIAERSGVKYRLPGPPAKEGHTSSEWRSVTGVWEGVSVNNTEDGFNIRLDLIQEGSQVRGRETLRRTGSTQYVDYKVKGKINQGTLDLSDEAQEATVGPHWCLQVSYHLVAYDDGWFRGEASDPMCKPNRVALHQSAEKTAETKFCNDHKEVMLDLMTDALNDPLIQKDRNMGIVLFGLDLKQSALSAVDSRQSDKPSPNGQIAAFICETRFLQKNNAKSTEAGGVFVGTDDSKDIADSSAVGGALAPYSLNYFSVEDKAKGKSITVILQHALSKTYSRVVKQ